MGLQHVLALPQQSPTQVGFLKDYDNWTKRQIEGGQTFVHWVGKTVPGAVARGDVSAERALLRSIEKYHLSTGNYIGIAYDWAVGNSGTLYRLRGEARSAATSGDVDRDGLSNNTEGDAVLLLVGPSQVISGRAEDTLFTLLEAFDRDVVTHREARGTITSCPGEALQRWVQQYRSGQLSQQRQHRAVAVSAKREPDREWARMIAHGHNFAYVERTVTGWDQFYPDGVVVKVHDIEYLVAVGFGADELVNEVGDGAVVVGHNADDTRLKTIEKIQDRDVPRRRPWST